MNFVSFKKLTRFLMLCILALGLVACGGGDSTPPAPDTTPDAFSFPAKTNVAISTLTESAAIQVAGINSAAAISVTGGEYSIDGGTTYTSTAGTVKNSARVKIRHTSSANNASETSTTLTIGGVSAVFTTTTVAATVADTIPDAFSFPAKNNVAISTLTESAAIQVTGIDSAAAISVTGGEYSIDGGTTYTSAAGTVKNSARVKVRHTSSASFATATTTTLTIGGVGADFTTTTITTPPVTVSGTVTYTSYPLLDTAGIDYANPVDKPIRGAVIELQIPPGTTVSTANTSDTGAYSFKVPENTAARIIVKAALGAPDFKVVDNTNGKALYVLSKDITTATSDLTQSFNAGSGWGGSDYTSTRAAAPFAILDVIYQAKKLVESVDDTITWVPLIVNWSTANKTVSGDKTIGEIATSHFAFDDKQLYILGQKGVDTDEYDTHVIGHEWGHYFEANHSASDSIGGDHTFDNGELLHPSLAFGEGYGYALAGMIMNDPKVIDTSGVSQGSSYVNNLETDKVDDAAKTAQNAAVLQDGYASEISVAEILYDFFDSTDEGAGINDTISLGFAPIYRVLTNGQKNTESFTSIFSFLHHLRIDQPGNEAAIDAIAAAENINSNVSDEFEDSTTIGTGLPHLYSIVPPDGTEVTQDDHGDSLKAFNTYGDISASDDGNKLLNQRFFATLISAAGCYTVTATAVTPAAADLKLQLKSFDAVDANFTGPESKSVELVANKIIVFSVSTFESSGATFKVTFAPTPSACAAP